MPIGPDWEQFSDTVRDAHTDVFDLPLVTFYNFTGGYDPSTGETDDWTRDSGTEVRAEVTVPNTPSTVTDPSGQQSEVKRRVYVRDDEDVDIHPIGTENHRPTEVESDGTMYVVAEKFDENNGQLRLLCVEAEG